jgi:hypothetical protein
MKTRLLLCFLLLSVVSGSCAQARSQTQADAIEIGTVRLTLEMPQASVLAKLGEDYEVSKVGHEDGWRVFEKGKRHGATVAWVHFENAKLRAVSKYWTVDSPDTKVALAKALYGAISSLGKGWLDCTVTVYDEQDPTEETQGVGIGCGRRSVFIEVSRDKEGETASVTERLASRRRVRTKP